ncbi:hypothetical protein [Nitrosomonas communis]|uniref:hypothetical protein n=1 Tax=Nitrosomonas communis TaxID=44574 RepID=UPI003D2946EE
MATISIEQQIEKVKRDLSQVAQKQVPFAIRLTVNKLAETAKKKFEDDELPRIDRPTRYAANMMRVQYAIRNNLTSTIKVKDRATVTKRGGFAPNEVLRHLFEGGPLSIRDLKSYSSKREYCLQDGSLFQVKE